MTVRQRENVSSKNAFNEKVKEKAREPFKGRFNPK